MRIEALTKPIILDTNTTLSNIIDINNQTKRFSNAVLLKMSCIPFQSTTEDLDQNEQDVFDLYHY